MNYCCRLATRRSSPRLMTVFSVMLGSREKRLLRSSRNPLRTWANPPIASKHEKSLGIVCSWIEGQACSELSTQSPTASANAHPSPPLASFASPGLKRLRGFLRWYSLATHLTPLGAGREGDDQVPPLAGPAHEPSRRPQSEDVQGVLEADGSSTRRGGGRVRGKGQTRRRHPDQGDQGTRQQHLAEKIALQHGTMETERASDGLSITSGGPGAYQHTYFSPARIWL